MLIWIYPTIFLVYDKAYGKHSLYYLALTAKLVAVIWKVV